MLPQYGVKGDIAFLLGRLWASGPHRASILALATSPAYGDFALSFLESIGFTFGAMLESLRKVREGERSKQSPEWAALDPGTQLKRTDELHHARQSAVARLGTVNK